jgi:protein TonB
MSTLTFTLRPDAGPAAAFGARLRAHGGPLAAIVLVHALLLYGVYSGLLHRVAQATLPAAVYVTFVAPPAPPRPAEAPLPTPAALPPPAMVVPSLPVLAVAPAENAISLPQAAPADKAAPAVLAVLAAAAPVPAVAAGPKTLTTGVEYLQAPQPVYPPLSKRMGEQGKVVLRILVNEKGQPDQVVVQTSSGSARLDEAGRQAALRALFKPHIEDGRPVAVFVIVPLNFTLAS